MKMGEIRERVYREVKKVHSGKVTTYGIIGKKLGISPRIVGYALHMNKDDNVPCHRVVNRVGRLAPTFSFGGYKEHRERLEKEGVKFRDETHVDIKEFMAFTK